jgi:phosphonate transport system substrate-binding protein
MRRWIIVAALAVVGLQAAACQSGKPASSESLHVLLIPADGGTESGTLADYQPLFNAISRSTGIAFDLKVAQTYGAVVEGMCNGAADIAFVGPTTYLQAQGKGCAELLAVAVNDGQSIYYSGLFAKKGSPVRTIADLRGKSVAFGDINSTSSFVFPLTMLLSTKLPFGAALLANEDEQLATRVGRLGLLDQRPVSTEAAARADPRRHSATCQKRPAAGCVTA